MEVLSCAKTTQLHGFPDFNTKCTHQLKEAAADFQFFKGNNCFVSITKNRGFELLGIKTVDGQEQIVPLRKLLVENIQCIACPKFGNGNEFALGQATGHIKFIDYKTFTSPLRFNPDIPSNSVSFLDYSSCNEYISSVYENGTINIYGMKTKNKMQTIKLDTQPTLARYHPVKRYHLAIASYSGALTVYDTSVKKVLFQKRDSHSAPCRDLTMSAQRPDFLATVGFDSIINIFDTRSRSISHHIESSHPFSTIDCSGCGNFLAVGNLKGEMIAYDVRNLNTVLNVQQLEQAPINRICFVPTNAECSEKMIFKSTEDSRASVGTVEESSPINGNGARCSEVLRRDSFVDFLGNFMEKKDFKSEFLSRASVGESSPNQTIDSRMSCGTRLSQDFQSNNLNVLLDDMFGENIESLPADKEANINTERLKRRKKGLNNTTLNETTVDCVTSSLSDAKITNKRLSLQVPTLGLSQINENDDKENSFDSISKTPEANSQRTIQNTSRVTLLNASSSQALNDINSATVPAALTPDLSNQLQEAFQTVKSEMLDEIRKEMKSAAFDAEKNKYHTFSFIFNSHRQQDKLIEKVQAEVDALKVGMSFLLQDDPFVMAYMKMKNENDDLRMRLAEYENK